MPSPNAERSDAMRAGAPSSHALAGALGALARLSQALRLYGADHASVAAAAAGTLTALESVDGATWPATLTVGRDHFSAGDSPVDAGPAASALARALHDSGIAAIALQRVPTRAELAAVAAWLATLPSPRAGVVPECAGVETACLRVVPVGAESLRFVGGPRDGSSSADWDALCRALAAESPGTLSAADKEGRERFDRATPEERRRAEEIIRAMADGGGRSERSQRAVAALAGLSPDLRRCLLAVCAGKDAAWIDSNTENLSVEDLAEALKKIDRLGRTPPPATILLLKKLVGLNRLGAAERGTLISIAAKWAPDDPSIGELMSARADEDWCPQDYRDSVSAAAGTNHAPIALPRGGLDLDPATLAVRTCEITLDLLGEDGNGEHAADHLRLLASRVALVAGAGCADVVLAVAEAASAHSRSPVEAIARAGRELGTAVGVPAVLAETVRRLGTDEASVSTLARLVTLLPGPIVGAIAERLASGEIGADHAHARCAAGFAPVAALRELSARAARGEVRCGAGLVALLASCPKEIVLGAAEPLAEAPDLDLGAQALRMLHERPISWPPRLVQLALTSADPALIEIGRVRLARDPGACSPEMLASLLGGSLTGELPDERTASIAVRALVARGEGGIDRAAATLAGLSRGVNFRRIEICRRLAVALRPHAARPAVKEALRAWRGSASGVLVRLFTDDSARRAA